LGQECIYLAREQHNPRAERNPGVTKRYVKDSVGLRVPKTDQSHSSGSKERVSRLESQVGQIYDILQYITLSDLIA
jgi:hypothetical protein